MNPIRIGFHTGPGGNPTGIGNYVRALDEAGIPATIVAADVTTGLSDVYGVWAAGSQVQHVTAFRVVRDGTEFYSVPNYDLSPMAAAHDYVDRVRPHIPPEITAHKGRTWIVMGNELDKNRADWLGEWGLHVAIIMNNLGYKVLLFGFAGGEPEDDHWQAPGMRDYLEYCAENPHIAGVALHEYCYHPTDLLNGAPWLVGRYTHLYDACDLMGIGYPFVLITEFGYQHNKLPDKTHHWSTQNPLLYEEFPDYPHAAFWYLGAGYEGIANLAQTYIQEATWRSLNDRIAGELAPVGNQAPPPTPVECGRARVPYNRKFYACNDDFTLDEWLAVCEMAYHDNRATVGFSRDDAAQGVGMGRKDIVEVGGQYSAAVIEKWYKDEYCVPAENVTHLPRPGDGDGTEFSGYTWPVRPLSFTDWSTTDPWPGGWFSSLGFGVWYTNPSTGRSSYHTGDDCNNNRPRWDADNGADLYAVADGMIVFAGWLPVWGNIVILRVDDPDNGLRWFRYSHMARMDVEEGYEVTKGMVLGTVGIAASGGAAHLHFDVCYTPILEDDPGNWPGAVYPAGADDPAAKKRQMDYLLRHYQNPTTFLLDVDAEYLPPAGTPPATSSVRFGIHASADSRNMTGDVEKIGTIAPDLIKVLSSHNPDDVRALAVRAPFAEYIVRAFLDFGGRNVSPSQFFEWTKGDVARTIAALKSVGIKEDKIMVELGNEPNLATEGLWSSWENAGDFSVWFDLLLDLYEMEYEGTNVRLLFPGLSPGESINGLREHYYNYLSECSVQIARCDGIGVHTYWSPGWPIVGNPHSGVGPVDEVARLFPGRDIYVTECSHNGHGTPETQKAESVLSFWVECKRRPVVEGIAVFVLSASNPAWNHADGSGEVITETMANVFADR